MFADAGREIIGEGPATAIMYQDSPLTVSAAGDMVPRPGERVTRVTAGWARNPAGQPCSHNCADQAGHGS